MRGNVRKHTFGHVCPLKIQISLCIRAVWSESSLGTFWKAKDTMKALIRLCRCAGWFESLLSAHLKVRFLTLWLYYSFNTVCTGKLFIQLLSMPKEVDNLRAWYCSVSTLWKVMDWSNAIVHGLLNVTVTKYLLSQSSLVYTMCAKHRPSF